MEKSHSSWMQTSVQSEPRQAKLTYISERDPIPRARDGFLCIFEFIVDWRLGTIPCSHIHIGGSHLFSVVNNDEKFVKVLDVLWSCVCMVFISSGISEVLNNFPFSPCRPFTPCLLLSSSCCSCADRCCSLSAIHASEPTNTPALHSLLPCWGSALHELHSILPQVKQRRTQAATKKSFFFFFFSPANAQSS